MFTIPYPTGTLFSSPLREISTLSVLVTIYFQKTFPFSCFLLQTFRSKVLKVVQPANCPGGMKQLDSLLHKDIAMNRIFTLKIKEHWGIEDINNPDYQCNYVRFSFS